MMSLKIRELWLEWVAVCKKALLKCKLQICKICGTDAALTTALGITIWREFLFSLTSPLCTTTTNNLDSTFIELHFLRKPYWSSNKMGRDFDNFLIFMPVLIQMSTT